MLADTSFFFEEGQIYSFLIKGEVQLPPDDESFLILVSPFNSKHLLKKSPYINYQLTLGASVNCRIDKINCAAKIFLEPEHPFYKEGNIYDFNVLRKYTITNSDGNIEQALVLKDCFNQEFIIHQDDEIETTTSSVSYRVDRVKKGKLYLSLPDDNDVLAQLTIGNQYKFIVKDLMTRADNEEYYLLLDENVNKHYLRKKYYMEYGFVLGSEIVCTVVSTPLKFRHYLEPQHPKYKIGEKYDFIISGIETYMDVFGKEITHLMVNDGSEKEYFVQCPEINTTNTDIGTVIKCLLTDIRLSRLRLVCI